MRTVAIYAFDEVELLDFAGPCEVFTVASRVAARIGRPVPYAVTVIGPSSDSVRSRAGVVVVPEVSLSHASCPDVLIIPGG